MLAGTVIVNAAENKDQYKVSLYITPPEGAELVKNEVSFGQYKWVDSEGKDIRPMATFIYKSPSSDEGPTSALPMNYGENSSDSSDSGWQNLPTLTAENFPITIEVSYLDGAPTEPGFVVLNNIRYDFSRTETTSWDNSKIIVDRLELTTPQDIQTKIYDWDFISATLNITSDVDYSYTFGGDDVTDVIVSETPEKNLTVYPGAKIIVTPLKVSSFSKALYSVPASQGIAAYEGLISPVEGTNSKTWKVPSGDQYQTESPYGLKLEGPKMIITVISDTPAAKLLVTNGRLKTSTNDWVLPENNEMSLTVASGYRITEVIDNFTNSPARFDMSSGIVYDVADGMSFTVKTEAYLRNNKLYVFVPQNFNPDSDITLRLAPGKVYESIMNLKKADSSGNPDIRYIVKYHPDDLPLSIEKATFSGKPAYLYLNNANIKRTEEGYAFPDRMDDGSVIRIVSSNINKSAVPVTVEIENGVSVDLIVDGRILDPDMYNSGSFNIPISAVIDIQPKEGNTVEYTATYKATKSSGSDTGSLSANPLRVSTSYSRIYINVNVNRSIPLVVYVEESDDKEYAPATDIILSPGSDVEKMIALSKGYNNVLIAKNDLPLCIKSPEGRDATVYLNNELLPFDEDSGYFRFPAELPTNPIVKIFTAEQKPVSVSYNFSTSKYTINVTHDNIDELIDTSLTHTLLPGTEIRFTVNKTPAEGSESSKVQRKVNAIENSFIVKANDEEIDPEEDGSYMVKVSKEHSEDGLAIKIEDRTIKTGLDEIFYEGKNLDVYDLNGICLLKSASKADIYCLPAGTYIINGKKLTLK